MEDRDSAFLKWVSAQLGGNVMLTSVSGDASFRHYFRVPSRAGSSCGSCIAVDSPPKQEKNHEFAAIARALYEQGLAVPELIAVDLERGFMLLSDLGDSLLLPELNAQTVEALYDEALENLLKMQCRMSSDVLKLPLYDGPGLLAEMDLFRDWFVPHYLELVLSADQHNTLEQAFKLLSESALAQPLVFVHRDYHARNIMLLPQARQGIIDFQDALWGPLTYDLVSLLRDCYIRWPREQVRDFARTYYTRLQQAGLLPSECSEAQFFTWFDLMGMQRHLKAIGIFARLNTRDNKPAYLADIPRTFRYLLEVSADYEALGAFHALLLTFARRLSEIDEAAVLELGEYI